MLLLLNVDDRRARLLAPFMSPPAGAIYRVVALIDRDVSVETADLRGKSRKSRFSSSGVSFAQRLASP
jgi:hypothetical protein